MALYLSHRQMVQTGREAPVPPLLLYASCYQMQHDTLPGEGVFYDLLQDAFELTNLTNEKQPYVFLPSGCSLFVFFLDRTEPKGILCGPLTKMRKIWIPAQSSVFCVRLKAGAGGWLTGRKAFSLVDRAVPISQYFSEADEYLPRIYKAGSMEKRCAFLLGLLDTRRAYEFQIEKQLSAVIDLIQQTHGCCRIAAAAEAGRCSGRHLSQIFKEQLGISAKVYCEMVRFQYSLRNIILTQPKTLVQVADSYGYYDLPHMNRSYQKFLGYTASDLRYTELQDLNADEIVVQ